jgi:cell division ATPase FtsA
MRGNSVAVLDIRSSSLCAVVGERGVNNTFIIKSKYTADYDGFAEGEFLDVKSFGQALFDVVSSTISAMGGIKHFYVGVPGEFIKVVNSDKVISFKSAKKISASDCNALSSIATPDEGKSHKIIRASCLYYVLSDKRRIIDPVGEVSDSLSGKFSFFLCKTSFIDSVYKAFEKFEGIKEIDFIPSNYAEGIYLIEPEKRDEYAVLFDLGFISSTYSVVCGNGLAYSESFSVGIGHIAVYLMSELDIPYDVAISFLSRVNLNSKEKLTSSEEILFEGKTYSFSTVTLREKIREGLDGLCETLEECIQCFSGKNLDGKTIYLTGDCVKTIRGTAEHLSGRLVKNVEIIAPKVPYYDKPEFSSLLSLLDVALSEYSSKSFFSKLFIGGK